MTTNQTLLEDLKAKYQEARKLAHELRTPEAREACKAAWAAVEEIAPPMKQARYGSRAGKRQQAERRWMERVR